MEPGPQFIQTADHYGVTVTAHDPNGHPVGMVGMAPPRVTNMVDSVAEMNGRLFDHQYKPPVVTHLAASRGEEHLVPTLLGLVAQHSLRHWQQLPAADDDLSVHSAPLVRRLVERGIVTAPKGNPNITSTNDADKGAGNDQWIQDVAHVNTLYGTPVPAPQVRQASQLVRGLLRTERARTSAHRQTEFDLGYQ